MLLFGNDLKSYIFLIPALLICISIHEFAHAFVAYKLGDRSQKYMGRLTLYPFAHIDIMGMLMLVLIGFGWGKPVQYSDNNFKNRNLGNLLVAIAGPISNILLAIFTAVIFKVLIMTGLITASPFINTLFMYVMLVNSTLAVFNLIPLPPLDGSKIVRSFLSYKWKIKYDNITQYSFIILIILIYSGLLDYIMNPMYKAINYILSYIIYM